MLIRDQHILAERRKLTKPLLPGVIALPGGHMDAGEQPATALAREVYEELGVQPTAMKYVCTLLDQAEEIRMLHYFAVTRWEGEIQAYEAEDVFWLSLHDLSALALYVDRLAIAEYQRIKQFV